MTKLMEDYLGEIISANVYDRYQLMEIKRGIKSGLSIAQLEVYMATNNDVYGQPKPIFDSYQMREIRTAFEKGFTFEEVASFAKPRCDYVIMQERKAKIEKER